MLTYGIDLHILKNIQNENQGTRTHIYTVRVIRLLCCIRSVRRCHTDGKNNRNTFKRSKWTTWKKALLAIQITPVVYDNVITH